MDLHLVWHALLARADAPTGGAALLRAVLILSTSNTEFQVALWLQTNQMFI